MKLFALPALLCLIQLTISSPLPPKIETEKALLEDTRPATPEEVFRIFGYATFDEFLVSQVAKHADHLTTIFERSTQSVCQKPYFVLIEDVQAAIGRLASNPAGTRCRNTQLPPGCTILKAYGSARIGICGPTTTSLLCSTVSKYLEGIMNTCKYKMPLGGTQFYTGGYQGLNENTLNYVFIDRNWIDCGVLASTL
jgi:hypothetical protein